MYFKIIVISTLICLLLIYKYTNPLQAEIVAEYRLSKTKLLEQFENLANKFHMLYGMEITSKFSPEHINHNRVICGIILHRKLKQEELDYMIKLFKWGKEEVDFIREESKDKVISELIYGYDLEMKTTKLYIETITKTVNTRGLIKDDKGGITLINYYRVNFSYEMCAKLIDPFIAWKFFKCFPETKFSYALVKKNDKDTINLDIAFTIFQKPLSFFQSQILNLLYSVHKDAKTIKKWIEKNKDKKLQWIALIKKK